MYACAVRKATDELHKLELHHKCDYRAKAEELSDLLSSIHTLCQRPSMAGFLCEQGIGKLLLPLVTHAAPSVRARVFAVFTQLCRVREFPERFTAKERLLVVQRMRQMHSQDEVDAGVVWAIVEAFDKGGSRPMKPIVEYKRQKARPMKDIVKKIYDVRDYVR